MEDSMVGRIHIVPPESFNEDLCLIHNRMDKHVPHEHVATLLSTRPSGDRVACGVGLCSCGGKIFFTEMYERKQETTKWYNIDIMAIKPAWTDAYNKLLLSNERLLFANNYMVSLNIELANKTNFDIIFDGKILSLKERK